MISKTFMLHSRINSIHIHNNPSKTMHPFNFHPKQQQHLN